MEPTDTKLSVQEAATEPGISGQDSEISTDSRSLTPDVCPLQPAPCSLSPEQRRGTPRLYDFSQHPLLSAYEFRKLEAHHVEILRGLASRLSIYFRLEIDLTLVSLMAPTFRQFISGLSQPTHVMLFKIEPLRGICVLEIPPPLGLTMADRLMGGSDQTVAAGRALSQIEASLLDQIAQFICEEWCAHWTRWQELKPALLGHESDPRYLQTSPPDSTTFVVTMNARLGECIGQLQLAFPFPTLEPLIQKLRAELKPVSDTAPETATPKETTWNPVLDDVKISIAAELRCAELPAREISRLKVGQMLNLPANSEEHVQLRLAGLPRFRGRLGTRNNHWAVEVSQILNT